MLLACRIGNWERFIILEDNKASLAHFLSTEISESYSAPPGRELVINGGFKETLKVWSSDTLRQDVRELASDHEEADTRIVLHARDAAARGYKQVNILCRDTDVLVLLLHFLLGLYKCYSSASFSCCRSEGLDKKPA